MVVSQAIVTSHGGMTSHAAVVARGMGTCCVAGCGELSINEYAKTIVCDKVTLREGDILSVDGTSGKLYTGNIPTTMIDNNDELQLFLSWADEVAQLSVRANAETIQDLKTAMQFGAKGIGLARTEHMFFGEKRILEMRRLILSNDEVETNSALKKLLAFQEEDFYQMFQTIQDKPMIVRLLDPPMHEFLPKINQKLSSWLKNYKSLLRH
ncbi:PEP-utilizing enzyme, mobile domain protein [Streptococcus constellatus subsp. pharyngis SK1060 = CCUG 46377]|uniref:Pyruvate, phosphate dikinase n=1 Tax=Streptococcus constellatus subsp. pharyngis SK1060 = CCUG 46377 TaxID=1035184 RepID=F9P6N2_STRCV|nr:PEP-utilizing enzyme, mobile domain protein [Streptococcus constellatus subsp. pharyngis SK1060 = CCUG 46377]